MKINTEGTKIYQYMKVVQMKPVHGAASEYSQSQVIMRQYA
jgi:hypothetical protein